jgi:hypothetical protein
LVFGDVVASKLQAKNSPVEYLVEIQSSARDDCDDRQNGSMGSSTYRIRNSSQFCCPVGGGMVGMDVFCPFVPLSPGIMHDACDISTMTCPHRLNGR